MACEVDRLLLWTNRVQRLEADLRETDSAMHGLIQAKLESARRSELAALAALVSAADSGDPEAIVARDALLSEKRAGWERSRPAA